MNVTDPYDDTLWMPWSSIRFPHQGLKHRTVPVRVGTRVGTLVRIAPDAAIVRFPGDANLMGARVPYSEVEVRMTDVFV